VDPAAGLETFFRIGDKVEKGQVLFHLHSSSENGFPSAKELLLRSISFGERPPQNPLPLIAKVLT
jgi:thymidine phosphorylase